MKDHHRVDKIGRRLPAVVAREIDINKFSRGETLMRLRELLTRTSDEAECQRIVKLIEDKEVEKPWRQIAN